MSNGGACEDLRADINERGGGYCDLPRWKEGRRSKQCVTIGGGRSGLRTTVAAGGARFGDSYFFCLFLPARSTRERRWEEGVRVGDVWRMFGAVVLNKINTVVVGFYHGSMEWRRELLR